MTNFLKRRQAAEDLNVVGANEAKINEAIEAMKQSGVAQGYIVALMHGIALRETQEMMELRG